MPTNVNDIIKKLPLAQRKRIETRAAQLIAEEMTLRQLRHARKLTQQKLAKSCISVKKGFPSSNSVPIC